MGNADILVRSFRFCRSRRCGQGCLRRSRPPIARSWQWGKLGDKPKKKPISYSKAADEYLELCKVNRAQKPASYSRVPSARLYSRSPASFDQYQKRLNRFRRKRNFFLAAIKHQMNSIEPKFLKLVNLVTAKVNHRKVKVRIN